jgi:ParB family chromosome partitioning protein
VARPGGLGKGLGALIPAAELATVGAGLDEVPISAIRPNRHQPRGHFDEESLNALAESIREVGVLQPILLRADDDGYELIAGERRWRAARRAGLTTIPAIVRTADELGALQQAVIENVQREGLNPLEEAAAYQELIEDFGLTHDEVATRVGRNRVTITNTVRLLALPPQVQKALQDGSIRMGHARALLGTPDRAFQERLAERVVRDGLSVRAVEDAVREHEHGGSEPARRAGAAAVRPPGLLELENLLGDHLDTRVKVTMGPKHGRLTIEFATLEDLERIYRVMTQGRPG